MTVDDPYSDDIITSGKFANDEEDLGFEEKPAFSKTALILKSLMRR